MVNQEILGGGESYCVRYAFGRWDEFTDDVDCVTLKPCEDVGSDLGRRDGQKDTPM
jgi:hypothetical protein